MHLPQHPIAVIFDMDGLLFDTEALYQKAIGAAAADGGHDLSAAAGRMVGRPIDQSRRLLLELYGPGFPVEDFFDDMFRHFDLLAANVSKCTYLSAADLSALHRVERAHAPGGRCVRGGHRGIPDYLHG